jgi:hypothetical protein
MAREWPREIHKQIFQVCPLELWSARSTRKGLGKVMIGMLAGAFFAGGEEPLGFDVGSARFLVMGEPKTRRVGMRLQSGG